MIDTEERTFPASTARACLSLMQAESIRIAALADALSAHVRIQQAKVESTLLALAASDPEAMRAVHAAQAAPPASLAVPIAPGDFPTTEILIGLLQAGNPDLSHADCLTEIFTSGLSALAHRLIPTP